MPAALPSPHATSRIWIARVALILGGPLLFLLLLEGALRLIGFGRDASYFVPDEKPGWYRSNPRFTETFFPASFGLKPYNFRLPRVKPADTARVFVLGESAAMGVPEPGFALAPQLRAQLRAAYPGKRVEVYNLGITAINSHVIRLIAQDAARFSPDAFLVYMGNNEVVGPFGPGSAITDAMLPRRWIRASTWARTTRAGQLIESLAQKVRRQNTFRDWRGMEMFAGRTVAATDPRLEAVYANFAANLDDILGSARQAGAKVVLSTVAVDLADCAPFASVHRLGLSPEELAHWEQAALSGAIAAELERWTDAERLFAEALRVDPDYAETEFRLARVLAARGDAAKAKLHYGRALERDALRFRADARINEIIRQAARAHPREVTLVDAAEALGSTPDSPVPAASHRWFFEHVHFTWDGNVALSRLLAPALGEAIFGATAPTGAWLAADACARQAGFTSIGRLMMLMRMNELTGRPPFTSQLTFAADRAGLQEQINAEYTLATNPRTLTPAVAMVEAALEQDPENAFLTFHAATAESEIGNLTRALELNARLATLEPPSAEAISQRAFLLRLAHRDSEAERLLLASAETEPYYFQTYTQLSQLWGDTHLERARQYFAERVQQMPDSAVVRLAYAEALARHDDWGEAETQWRAILRRTPDNEAALTPLAKRLVAAHANDAALQLMLDAYRYNPRSFPNNERLMQYYAQEGDRARTIEFMQALALSGPVTPTLHADLGDFLLQAGRPTEALVEFTKARRAAEAGGDRELAQRAGNAIRDHGLTWSP